MILLPTTYPMKQPPSAKLITGHPLGDPLAIWTMAENCGLQCFDSSSKQHTGTIINALWDDGQFGPCLRFDGVGDRVNIANPGQLILDTTSITVNLFCKFDDVILTYDILISSGPNIIAGAPDAVYGNGWILYRNYNTTQLVFAVVKDCTVPTWVKTPFYATVANTWYMVTGVWDITTRTAKLYVNGVFVGSAINVNIDSFAGGLFNLGVGARYTGTIFGLYGLLDLPMVYNRALSDSEIQKLFYDPFCMFARRGWPVGFDTGAPPPPSSRALVIGRPPGVYSTNQCISKNYVYL